MIKRAVAGAAAAALASLGAAVALANAGTDSAAGLTPARYITDAPAAPAQDSAESRVQGATSAQGRGGGEALSGPVPAAWEQRFSEHAVTPAGMDSPDDLAAFARTWVNGQGRRVPAAGSHASPANWHWVNGGGHPALVTAAGWLDKPREHDA
ncbi:hypothetical protein [Streptomyces sp. FH025]|uniref:hypothetical protein n=1 Tax=Streptomyces sp. FH025 TaxID=2815937 RepID=UPI001A9EEF1A|nr:hypothetical protein [Streptomyces sp. FH025]MBO1419941.1 hypothetical protein [Streptomyces sp. FH025]